MREKKTLPNGKYTFGVRIDMITDLIARCPKCGGEIGLWSEEPETVCTFCDYKVFEREATVH